MIRTGLQLVVDTDVFRDLNGYIAHHVEEMEGDQTGPYAHSALASRSGGDIHEALGILSVPGGAKVGLGYIPTVIEDPLLSTALWCLLLLLLFDLGGLRPDFASTG